MNAKPELENIPSETASNGKRMPLHGFSLDTAVFSIFVLSWLILIVMGGLANIFNVILLLLFIHITLSKLKEGRFPIWKSTIGITIALSTLAIVLYNQPYHTQVQIPDNYTTATVDNLTIQFPNTSNVKIDEFGGISYIVYKDPSITIKDSSSLFDEEGVHITIYPVHDYDQRAYTPAYEAALELHKDHHSDNCSETSDISDINQNNLKGWRWEDNCDKRIITYVILQNDNSYQFVQGSIEGADISNKHYKETLATILGSMKYFQPISDSSVKTPIYSVDEIEWKRVELSNISMLVPSNSIKNDNSETFLYTFNSEQSNPAKITKGFMEMRINSSFISDDPAEEIAYRMVDEDEISYDTICGGSSSPLLKIDTETLSGWTFQADCLGEIHIFVLYSDPNVVDITFSLQYTSEHNRDAYKAIMQEMIRSIEITNSIPPDPVVKLLKACRSARTDVPERDKGNEECIVFESDGNTYRTIDGGFRFIDTFTDEDKKSVRETVTPLRKELLTETYEDWLTEPKIPVTGGTNDRIVVYTLGTDPYEDEIETEFKWGLDNSQESQRLWAIHKMLFDYLE